MVLRRPWKGGNKPIKVSSKFNLGSVGFARCGLCREGDEEDGQVAESAVKFCLSHGLLRIAAFMLAALSLCYQ